MQITRQTLNLSDPRIANELSTLRTELESDEDSDAAIDAIDASIVERAQKALKEGDESSFKTAIKRLGGKNWAKLHKLTYIVAILGVIHYWMIVKSDLTYPIAFAFILAVLLGYRVYFAVEARNSKVKV